MSTTDPKDTLQHYLTIAREALLWKLDGLSEYDVRRPLTPTGTNLLGLVKHLAMVEVGYFGDTFERPPVERFPWDGRELAPNEDMFASEDESREEIVDGYRRAIAHADATISARPLDAEGHVPWWPDDVNPVNLHWVLVHMIGETNRHCGHADVVRELIDGAVGHREANDNLPELDAEAWALHRELVETTARTAARNAGEA